MPGKHEKTSFKTSIGGQALLEGIMMRGPEKIAVVCRKNDGSLVTKVETVNSSSKPWMKLPFIRGIVSFLSSMTVGVKCLTWSAEQIPEDEQEAPGRFELWIRKRFPGDKAEKIILYAAVALGILLSVFLFAVLPTFLAGLLNRIIPLNRWRGFVEGIIKLAIFIGYLKMCSSMKEMARVWMYHGAEHKSIYCYEKGLPLTVENARLQSRFHPRCGTSFLFIVVFISILVFSMITTQNTLSRIGLHLLMLPLIVSISYEIIKWAGRNEGRLSQFISAPGKFVQRITTAEPDDSMLEVGLEALRLVLPEQPGKDDVW